MSLAGQTVFVIDANSLIFQVFHAIPEMTSPKGEPVNAVFGFVRDILYIAQTKEPNYLFCAFDMAGPTFRHELYADYKVHRTEMPDELVPQFPAIRRVLQALGVPILELESYEADDILATLARVTEELGGECYLVTADKDCRQLITDHVKVYNVRKNLVYDAAELAKEWGVSPAASGRLSGAGGRPGRPCARRAAHRTEAGQGTAAKIRHARLRARPCP